MISVLYSCLVLALLSSPIPPLVGGSSSSVCPLPFCHNNTGNDGVVLFNYSGIPSSNECCTLSNSLRLHSLRIHQIRLQLLGVLQPSWVSVTRVWRFYRTVNSCLLPHPGEKLYKTQPPDAFLLERNLMWSRFGRIPRFWGWEWGSLVKSTQSTYRNSKPKYTRSEILHSILLRLDVPWW